MLDTLKRHWPEYLMEVAGLGLFMISASVFATILEYPASPVHQALPNPVVRRLLMGMAMGLTAAGLIYSPWGQRSGAHINPSVTLTFLRLGKIEPRDAAFYMGAQFVGGSVGILAASIVLGPLLADPAVQYVATLPGPAGPGAAFLGEAAISFLLMLVVLNVSNAYRLSRFTGLFVAVLVATYITLEAPISGMSMNPARTFGPTLLTGLWGLLWIYFTAPPLGMLLAAELYVRLKGPSAVLCAKLHHDNDKRCIFRCNYQRARAGQVGQVGRAGHLGQVGHGGHESHSAPFTA